MHPHKHMHRQLVLNHWACQDSCLLFPWILPSCGGPVRQVGTGQKATWKEDTGKIAKIRLLIVGLCTALLIGAMTVRGIMSISVFLGHRESLDFELEAETGLTPPSPPVWAGYVSVGRSLEACTNIWLSRISKLTHVIPLNSIQGQQPYKDCWAFIWLKPEKRLFKGKSNAVLYKSVFLLSSGRPSVSVSWS